MMYPMADIEYGRIGPWGMRVPYGIGCDGCAEIIGAGLRCQACIDGSEYRHTPAYLAQHETRPASECAPLTEGENKTRDVPDSEALLEAAYLPSRCPECGDMIDGSMCQCKKIDLL